MELEAFLPIAKNKMGMIKIILIIGMILYIISFSSSIVSTTKTCFSGNCIPLITSTVGKPFSLDKTITAEVRWLENQTTNVTQEQTFVPNTKRMVVLDIIINLLMFMIIFYLMFYLVNKLKLADPHPLVKPLLLGILLLVFFSIELVYANVVLKTTVIPGEGIFLALKYFIGQIFYW